MLYGARCRNAVTGWVPIPRNLDLGSWLTWPEDQEILWGMFHNIIKVPLVSDKLADSDLLRTFVAFILTLISLHLSYTSISWRSYWSPFWQDYLEYLCHRTCAQDEVTLPYFNSCCLDPPNLSKYCSTLRSS